MHTAATVDSATLAEGEFAPVASAHVALSLVLYPVSGVALAALGLALVRTWRGPHRVVAGLAVLGGTLHALSAPVALLLPDAPARPLFAAAGMSLALWSIATGLLGTPRAGRQAAPARRLQRA